jgi:diguanylate cyclase (GGDEF)-like protein
MTARNKPPSSHGSKQNKISLSSREEAEKLNLLELELIKGLQHMIGETEEPVAIFKHAFTLIKNYLVFDVFAALVPRRGDEEIYVYPNTPIRSDIAEAIPGTLLKRMARLAEDTDQRLRVVIQDRSSQPLGESDDLRSIIVPLMSRNRTYGYAGIYRKEPFGYTQESVFKRFCAHISTALEKISLFEEIKALSTNDGLTGLYNHMYVMERVDQEIQRSSRYGSPLSIIMADIDDFKEVNDTYGHIAGDTVLAHVAGLLKSGVRNIDCVGRYGGEEFLIILPETDQSSATLLAERLRHVVQEHACPADGYSIKTTLSAGVAIYRDSYSTKDLIHRADENLYKAKKAGKNKVYYEET